MPFGLELTGWTLFWIILGSVVVLLIEALLFKAACALGDVDNPSWLITFVIVVPFVVLRALAAWGIFLVLKPYLVGIALYLVTIAISGVGFWVLCTGLYSVLLSVPIKKGFFTAGAQEMLDVLIGALGTGIALVVVSIIQIKEPPKQNQKSGQVPSANQIAAVARPAVR